MMLFSQVGQYALRIVATLAQQNDASPLRAADIAERTGIPSAYVSKVLRRLTEAELLTSQKGHHGGFRLAKPANKTRFVDVLSAVDSLPAQKTCVFGWGACQASKPCPLHNAWADLSTRVFGWAESTSLAELTQLNAPRARKRR